MGTTSESMACQEFVAKRPHGPMLSWCATCQEHFDKHQVDVATAEYTSYSSHIGRGPVHPSSYSPYHEHQPTNQPLQSQLPEDSGQEDQGQVDWSDLTEDELDDYLRKLFFIADRDGDGVLQQHEYMQLMRSSSLQFSEELISQGFMAADKNRDGVIQYEELVTTLKAMLQGINSEGQFGHFHLGHSMRRPDTLEIQ